MDAAAGPRTPIVFVKTIVDSKLSSPIAIDKLRPIRRPKSPADAAKNVAKMADKIVATARLAPRE